MKSNNHNAPGENPGKENEMKNEKELLRYVAKYAQERQDVEDARDMLEDDAQGDGKQIMRAIFLRKFFYKYGAELNLNRTKISIAARCVLDQYPNDRHQYPVGKAQQTVLDVLEITYAKNSTHADAIFDALQIVVSPMRVGWKSVPCVWGKRSGDDYTQSTLPSVDDFFDGYDFPMDGSTELELRNFCLFLLEEFIPENKK